MAGLNRTIVVVAMSLFIFALGKLGEEALTEEDQLNDLMLLIKLMTNLLTKEFVDFGT